MTQHFFSVWISYQFATVHTASYKFLMKPEKLAECHQLNVTRPSPCGWGLGARLLHHEVLLHKFMRGGYYHYDNSVQWNHLKVRFESPSHSSSPGPRNKLLTLQAEHRAHPQFFRSLAHQRAMEKSKQEVTHPPKATLNQRRLPCHKVYPQLFQLFPPKYQGRPALTLQ